ncbi:fluoride efflux transporter FluC [Corynebacterium sanguinis]|uniref:fluoride efflux transporter FluC n=1 Tax=Corynebacterium sanguinis TaxID=2594913 RepID=UPI0011A59BAD|nr:CrcB family protein [Corynebacterium sanguinis]MCT1411454.1 CrcB family protein [Corynebacterium sanguinis]MCT1414121.1 CrcB family protein [Corynebacterium sanguinis]MCT1444219.1 CrcB family protein [Corynebacterium sanguinis]MCT1499249.1 CrcB family protein [Corynebacterium sanguinis]MCT1597175.1 CrcB family protein [Corynebacterium sanguinis]
MISLAIIFVLMPAGAVTVGAFLGGLARWGLSRIPGGLTGTLLANLFASIVIGLSLGLEPRWQVFLGVGFAGALSTWSTLAKELGQLIKEQAWRRAGVYAVATAVLGAGGAYLGYLTSGVGLAS